MLLKWIGGLFIIASCGSVGFRIAANQRKEEKTVTELIASLDYMMCELQYRLTPLPDLCRNTSQYTSGILKNFYLSLSQELEDQVSPNVECCMRVVVSKFKNLPNSIAQVFLQLGKTMGRFDINGQIKGLDAARHESTIILKKLQLNKAERLRSYQTLGICAGAALAILFI